MPTIVVPVVQSPGGDKALELARQEAIAKDADLILVGTANVSENVGDNVHAVQTYLAKLEAEISKQGLRCQTEWSVGGSLGQATLAAAREHDAKLIVLALRRRSAAGKALFGSYEQEILLDAPCPVLSVRAPFES